MEALSCFRAQMWMGKLYELVNDTPKAIYHYERLVFEVQTMCCKEVGMKVLKVSSMKNKVKSLLSLRFIAKEHFFY